MVKTRERLGEMQALVGLRPLCRIWTLSFTQTTGIPNRKWNSESQMRKNRPSGLMRGGKQTVIGTQSSHPSLPAYSTPRETHNYPHGGGRRCRDARSGSPQRISPYRWQDISVDGKGTHKPGPPLLLGSAGVVADLLVKLDRLVGRKERRQGLQPVVSNEKVPILAHAARHGEGHVLAELWSCQADATQSAGAGPPSRNRDKVRSLRNSSLVIAGAGA